ncbi:MAG: hypothetical protein Q9188_007009 [Gyalolechia gomerana]
MNDSTLDESECATKAVEENPRDGSLTIPITMGHGPMVPPNTAPSLFLYLGKFWAPGRELKISFFAGTGWQKDEVKQYAPMWWPFLASISRIWIILKTMEGDMEHTQRALHKKHGSLVRIAPNEVACSDPRAIKTIYGTKTTFTKTDYYDAWAPPNNGYIGHFPARDEKEHSERRRIINNAYSMSSVLASESAIDSCTQLFCETMRDFAAYNTVIDLGLWINMDNYKQQADVSCRYAFNVLGELFYGKIFGFMREHADIDNYIKAIDSLLPAFTIGGTLPFYLTKLYFVYTVLFSLSVRGALGTIKYIKKASEAAVERRKQEILENKEDRHDILGKLLEITADRGEKLNFTYQHVCVESHSSIFAGADTTAIAINSILYHLMRNPTAYEKLTTEVDVAVAESSLSMPVACTEAIKLPYLNACINEGIRLQPSIGLTMPQLVPAGGATISGFYFPEGYRVGVNGAVVHYDKDVFGPDAEHFNPDRWIEGDAERMKKTMIQFGAGSRTCIGKNVSADFISQLPHPRLILLYLSQISLSEIYKLVPQIVRAFQIRLADPSKQWKTHNYWFNKQTDIHVLLKERT